MTENKQNIANSTLQTLSDIPESNSDAKEIIGLVKKEGDIVGYKLSDDTIINKSDAVDLAKNGGIKGVGIATNKGVEYLRSLPDETESNNLSNLPYTLL